MKTEAITRDNLSRYMHMLTNDEIFANDTQRYSCFGAFDEATGEGLGVIVASVLPEYILIEKLFTDEKNRGKGVASELLSLVTTLPDGVTMPFYFATAHEDINDGVIKNKGFAEIESRYKFQVGKLEDMRDITVSDSMKAGLRIQPAYNVSEKLLSNFVFRSEFDRFLQFPETVLDMDRFSEGSLVCLQNDKICAVMLIEELQDAVQFTFIHCLDTRSLFGLFSIVKPALRLDYGKDSIIRFLICDGKGEEGVRRAFGRCHEQPVRVFRKE